MEPILGQIIGDRYKLVEHICETLMSSVFKAWDSQDNCFVAMKIATNVPERCSNAVKYLERESFALHSLDHPRVVRFLNCGYHKSYYKSYFVVLEYLEGIDLSTCLDKIHCLPFEVAISIMREILEGMEALHQAGLIHRDLKPENLMITPRGVKIIDLGLVKFASESRQDARPLNKPGMTFGTLPYLSPEQACDRSDLDGRSDIFACGVVFYEILTGMEPFTCGEFVKDGRTVEYWKFPMRLFSEVLPPVSVPENVQAIVWKALSVNPNDRYQTAREMLMELPAVQSVSFEKFLADHAQRFKRLTKPLIDTQPLPSPK